MNALDPQKMTLACRPKIIFLNQLFAITQFQDLFVKDHSRFAGGSLQSEQITTGSVHGPIIIAGSAVACDRHPGGHCAKGLQKYRCRWRRHLFFIPTSQCPCRSDRHHQYCPWTLRGCTCRWATKADGVTKARARREYRQERTQQSICRSRRCPRRRRIEYAKSPVDYRRARRTVATLPFHQPRHTSRGCGWQLQS
jgi:hypothetical protein